MRELVLVRLRRLHLLMFLHPFWMRSKRNFVLTNPDEKNREKRQNDETSLACIFSTNSFVTLQLP